MQFTLQERVQRVVLWINRHFLLNVTATNELILSLVCLRDGRDVVISVESSGKVWKPNKPEDYNTWAFDAQVSLRQSREILTEAREQFLLQKLPIGKY